MIYLIFGLLNIVSYTLGLYIGLKINNKPIIEKPKLKTKTRKLTKIEKNELKKIEDEINKTNIALDNINNYNGSSEGQVEVK